MKHVTFAEKSLFMDDAAAETLLEYARLIANEGMADSVTLRAISSDGNTVEASFLLNANTVLMIESTNSTTVAPDNTDITRDMRDRMVAISRPAQGQTEEAWAPSEYGMPGEG